MSVNAVNFNNQDIQSTKQSSSNVDNSIQSKILDYFSRNNIKHATTAKYDRALLNEHKFEFKDPITMDFKEWANALKKLGFKPSQESYYGYELYEKFNDYITKIALNDKNSDKIDYHIGSFVQGTNNNCTFLSALATLPDKLIKEAITVKENGDCEVCFPADKEKKVITITKGEIDNRIIRQDGKTYKYFSSGDKDVLVLEMALLKRFGDIYSEGFNFKDLNEEMEQSINTTSSNIVRGLFYKNPKGVDSIHLKEKDLENIKPGTTISLLSKSEQIFMSAQYPEDDVIADKADRIILKDYTTLYYGHSYSLIKYDKKEQKLYLGDPTNTTFVVKVPVSMLDLLSVAK